MQLNASNTTPSPPEKPNKADIGLALAAATCGLLGQQHALAAGDPGTWDIDAALLYYGEFDDRVQAFEPVISATRYFDDDKTLNLKLAIDSLTGASPSGATPSDQIQTYTRPSGNGQYEVAANTAPLDDTFKDGRIALSASWSQPINRHWEYSAAIYGSNEHDYQSLGLNGTLSRYLNQKNTQLNTGLAFSFDTVNPEGGVPFELSRQPVPTTAGFDQAFAATRNGSSDTKTLIDLLFGVTQVINRRWVMQFNYSLSQADGYLTDPYKILSVINDTEGDNYGANALASDGASIYLHERRPDARTKHALFWQSKYMLKSGNVIDTSYRYMTDDWGIDSHTFELKYRWELNDAYIEPHLRYYLQSQADFYHRYLLQSDYSNNQLKQEFASADYRLGDLTGTTVGLKYGGTAWNKDFSVRLEYLLQTNSGNEGFGALVGQELYPDTSAVMFTIGFSY